MKFTKVSRRILKNALRGAGIAAVAIAFPGCSGNGKGPTGPMYGGPIVTGPTGPMPAYGVMSPAGTMDGYTIGIHGTVLSGGTQAPVPGIRISTEDLYSIAYTDENGAFYIYVPVQNEYELKFESIDDGSENGSFLQHKVKITLSDINESLNIHLSEAEENGEDAE